MTSTPTWTAPSSWAASDWSRPPTCPATTAGSPSSPTRTAIRSGCGAEDSGVTGRPPEPAGGGELEADVALRAIAEPRRRAILRLVARDELAAGEIAAAFDITRTAVS